ncbi:MAG: hypothetical protein DI629_12000 [Mesorhizobium amorphae]|nr:MAG: hypothetical protein DI629_12000 [Mesorhizobium amorphae]
MNVRDILWRETWPGEGHEDYSAYDGTTYIGRIYYRVLGGFNPDRWTWHTAWGGPHRSGFTASRLAAMHEIEERYDRRMKEVGRATP